jgi:hypothetical protein
MEKMNEKEISELMEFEFSELMYAWGSPLGATTSILSDYEDYFEKNSKEYYYHIKSLYLLNCASDNLKWYKEHRADFLERRVTPLLMEFIHFDSDEKEMRELTVHVKEYLFDEKDDFNEIENIMEKLYNEALKKEEELTRIRKLFGIEGDK